MIDWSEVERLEVYQLLTSKEKSALKAYFENGRNWDAAILAVYTCKSPEVASQIARRVRHRQEVKEILALLEDAPLPTAASIATALYRIGVNPKVKPNVRTDALDSAAIILGYKEASRRGRAASDDESIRRALEKFA